MCVGLSIHGVGECMCIHIFMYKIHKYWQIYSEAYCNSLCFKKIPLWVYYPVLGCQGTNKEFETSISLALQIIEGINQRILLSLGHSTALHQVQEDGRKLHIK